MLDAAVVNNLRERYSAIHPLAFHRSVERAESVGELFDILDTFPKSFPIVWDEQQRRWIHVEEASLKNSFDFEGVTKRKQRKRRRRKR